MYRKKINIFHIITSLEHGGAQLIATKLILNENKYFNHTVFVLINRGPYKEILKNKGIKVYSSKSSNFLFILFKVFKCYVQNRPDIVQTWMYHADFVGLILTTFFKKHKLIWSLHHSCPKENKFLTRVVITVCRFFSNSAPAHIVACSSISSLNHINYGYSAKNMMIIDNGVNFQNFTNLSEKKYIFNAKIVVGHIARWHPIKGHKFFIKMASNLYKDNKNFRFVLVGSGIEWKNKELVKLIEEYGLGSVVKLLGEQQDISKILNSLDIYVSTSISESFSLTLVEAIACKVLSISSDTGIARDALSNDLCIVKTKSSSELVSAVKSLIELPSEDIIRIVDDSYKIISEKFDERLMLDNYNNLYSSV